MSRPHLHILIVLTLLISAFVAALPTSAQETSHRSDQYDLYLPWVPNGVASIEGDIDYYGTVALQNLESVSIEVDVLVGPGEVAENGEPGGDWKVGATLHLRPHGSIALNASAIGIPSGEGAAVKLQPRLTRTVNHAETGLPTELELPARITAQVKTSGPLADSQGRTSMAHLRVDGYSALTAEHVESESNAWVLPIVQNNSDWETVVRIAHLGDKSGPDSSLTPISVSLIEASADEDVIESQTVDLEVFAGEVMTFVLSDVVDAPGWVGSAVIDADVPIAAVAERVKPGTDMLMMNTARPINPDAGDQYAPLVFQNYFGWSTGISVMNADSVSQNEITVTYYGPNMELVGEETLSVPPRGMSFIHSPGTQDSEGDGGFVGSAVLTGTSGFHAVVDQVKYAGSDEDASEAMSYVLERSMGLNYDLPEELNEHEIADLPSATTGTMLGLPLVQRGRAESPHGDVSGIQLFNPSSSGVVFLELTFYQGLGRPVDPTASAGAPNPMLVALDAKQTTTIYLPALERMESGFQGSVLIEVVEGNGGVVAVSNNVNYDVGGDGSTAFIMSPVAPVWQVYADTYCEVAGICVDDLEPTDPDSVEDD